MPVAATHWSTRARAAQLGLSAAARGGATDRSRACSAFKPLRDPRFENKLVHVVGLYRNPSEPPL